MLSYMFLISVGVVIIALLIGKPRWRQYKRKSIVRLPFKKQWRKIIQRRMPYFKKMPTDLQLQLKRHIQVFLSEKKFVGCQGIVINDDIKITIAAQACLL